MDLGIPREGREFTRNWFRNRNLKDFKELVYPHWSKARLGVRYLEIGVFEGQSMVWMMQHLVAPSGGRAVGIDPWLITTKLDQDQMDAIRERAFRNVSAWGQQCILQRGSSHEILRRMVGRRRGFLDVKKDYLDICMIDGDHNSYAVLDDARHCLKLLKPGGWMIFDDVRNDREKQDHVRTGLDMFLIEHGKDVEEIGNGRYIDIYQKKG